MLRCVLCCVALRCVALRSVPCALRAALRAAFRASRCVLRARSVVHVLVMSSTDGMLLQTYMEFEPVYQDKGTVVLPRRPKREKPQSKVTKKKKKKKEGWEGREGREGRE